MQFVVIVATDHKHTDRTDYNTLRRSFASAQCNYTEKQCRQQNYLQPTTVQHDTINNHTTAGNTATHIVTQAAHCVSSMVDTSQDVAQFPTITVT